MEKTIHSHPQPYCTWWANPTEPTIPEFIIDKFGRYVYGHNSDITMIRAEGHFIKVPVPNANDEWTKAAFEYILKVTEEYPRAYCDHAHEPTLNKIPSGSEVRYMFINCEYIKSVEETKENYEAMLGTSWKNGKWQ